MTPHNLTTAQLRGHGAFAADNGSPIYEASIRAGLTSDALLIFEQGYFERRFAIEQVGGQGIGGLDEGCFGHAPSVFFHAQINNA